MYAEYSGSSDLVRLQGEYTHLWPEWWAAEIKTHQRTLNDNGNAKCFVRQSAAAAKRTPKNPFANTPTKKTSAEQRSKRNGRQMPTIKRNMIANYQAFQNHTSFLCTAIIIRYGHR